jgi:uncharacterized repeat protein (TIGR02543 family)
VGVLSGVIAVAGGRQHTVALKSDGTVWAWGSNIYGQLGDGTRVNKSTPVQVLGEGGVGVLNLGSVITAMSSPPTGGTVSGGGGLPNGVPCTLIATANIGYTFVNWTDDGGVVCTTTNYTFTVSGGRTLTANFKANTYTANFIAPDGSPFFQSVVQTYNSPYVLPDTPTRAGHVFAGWFTDALAGTQVTTNTVFTETSTQTLFAHWMTAPVYFICTYTSVFLPVTQTYNNAFVLPSQPLRAGYSFVGWFTGLDGTGTQVTANTIFTGPPSQVLYAHWAEVQGVPVTSVTVDGSRDVVLILDGNAANARVEMSLDLSNPNGWTEVPTGMITPVSANAIRISAAAHNNAPAAFFRVSKK